MDGKEATTPVLVECPVRPQGILTPPSVRPDGARGGMGSGFQKPGFPVFVSSKNRVEYKNPPKTHFLGSLSKINPDNRVKLVLTGFSVFCSEKPGFGWFFVSNRVF